MTDIKKVNFNGVESMEIRECMGELRDRLHFLTLATTGLMEGGEVPSDNAICGVLHSFDDCKKIVDRVEVMAGGVV